MNLKSIQQRYKLRKQKKLRRRRLDYAIKEANRLHAESGKQYHVMEVDNDCFIVINNSMRKEYNKRLPKGQKVTISHLLNMAKYSTSSKRNINGNKN